MTRINTNVASLRGIRSLNKANNLLDTSLTRLSSGLKINSGKDNPSGLIASETLRFQVTTIEQSIRNSNRANNVIGTADAALGEITGLLNQIRGLVQEGLNSGALSQTEIDANQSQIDTALSAINRISANTTFAGDKLIDGSKAFRTELTSADAAKLSDFNIKQALFGTSNTITVDASVTAAATKGVLQYTGGAFTQAGTFEISGAAGTDVLFLGGSSTVDNIRTAINQTTATTGVEAVETAAATASTATLAAATTDDNITFSDARVAGGTGAAADLGTITIAFTQATDDNVTTTVTDTTIDTDGNATITIDLGTDSASAASATATDINTALNDGGNAEAVEALTVINIDTVESGTGVFDTDDGAALAGGTNATLELRSVNFGSSEFVGVNVLQGSFDTVNSSAAASTRESGTDIAVQINGQVAQGNGLRASLNTAGFSADVAFNTANNVATTDGQATITVTGGGSLFQIGQEVSAAGQLGLGIEAVNTARLGGSTGTLFELGSGGGKSLNDVGPNVPGSDLVNIIDEALDRVTSLRGRLGALQKNVIETNISTLGVALENISESRSQILDTDFASETADLTRAQILSQSTLSVLAIANQNPSQVLSLLG